MEQEERREVGPQLRESFFFFFHFSFSLKAKGGGGLLRFPPFFCLQKSNLFILLNARITAQ